MELLQNTGFIAKGKNKNKIYSSSIRTKGYLVIEKKLANICPVLCLEYFPQRLSVNF